MRLRRLDLTRYGKFTGEAIDFGPAQAGVPDLHVVYGLNEAGKSTALSAYLDLLFGIENASRYGFLHPYPSMQVGARLDFGGAEHELVRVKARVNSLLDGKNQPVNEALLSVPLAGLTRESYRSMFSLDDQSLEDGGNAIIASKGELGELLFAASAGLADLGTILARVRDEADTIHKQRGRTTQIAELKRALGELKTEQDAIDTRASTHAALAAALKQAETAYAEVMHIRGLAKLRHEEIARTLRAAPLATDYRRLSAEITALGELPDPPAEWAGQVSGLMIKNAELAAQIAGTQAELARLDAEIAALVIDEPVLAQGDAIVGLAEGMARFATAEADLPRRQAAIAEDEAAITAILRGLGQHRDATPENLLLPASVVGTLRDLIEARSGIEAKASTARSELAQARDSLERAMGDMGDEGRPELDPAQLHRVNAALGALRRSDHQARIRLAERELPAVSRRYESLRDGLGHWPGDGDELRALGLPEPRQLDRWRLTASTIDRRRNEQGDKLRELNASQREHSARIAAIHASAGGIDDREAARLRAARDAAWSAHAATLDAVTAAAFAAALQADDALGAARLAYAQDLAELRNLQQGLAVIEAGLVNGNEVLEQLEAENAALAGEIRAAIDKRIPMAKGAGVTLWLEQLEGWMRQRQEVLTAWQGLEETRDDLASAKADLVRDLAIL
ncbi:MAG TPA: AAA family ATPase, partial [Devosia sp.]